MWLVKMENDTGCRREMKIESVLIQIVAEVDVFQGEETHGEGQ